MCKERPSKIDVITAKCKDCGKEFEISIKEQLFAKEGKGFVLPKRCPDCRQSRKDKSKFIFCIDCGEPFRFTANEQEFYAKKGFDEPRRCVTCRKAKKANNGQGITEKDK